MAKGNEPTEDYPFRYRENLFFSLSQAPEPSDARAQYSLEVIYYKENGIAIDKTKDETGTHQQLHEVMPKHNTLSVQCII